MKKTIAAILATTLSLAAFTAPAAAAAAPGKGSGTGLGQDRVVVDPQTEAVINGALKYLAAQQQSNGSWVSKGSHGHDVAMTGYVLMTYMACGHLPDEGEYGKNVAAGLAFLMHSVKPDGFINSSNTNMYGHGVATIALAEAYGQTKNAELRGKVQSAVKLIVSCQNNEGGWRYPPRVDDADISVTVLQVVALRAAKNAGLDVPQETINRAVQYVRKCYNEREGGFSYQPKGGPGFARTAAAIYSLQVCGEYDDPRVKKGSEYLFKKHDEKQWFTYGHFYAAPAQYMIGGDTWEKWYKLMRDKLVSGATRAGDQVYWDPKWDESSKGLGNLYFTTVYTTILAMPYHYLPLYQR